MLETPLCLFRSIPLSTGADDVISVATLAASTTYACPFFFFCLCPSQILEMVDFSVTDGLVDLRLFAVIASLAQKVAAME